jgi:hypothetical protein
MLTISAHRAVDPTGNCPNDLNNKIQITAVDEPGSGGAYHLYELQTLPAVGAAYRTQMCFHHIEPGKLIPTEPNGFSNESFLAVLLHRLECFQAGPFACPENEAALTAGRAMMAALQSRTLKRAAQGVEGKLEAHDSQEKASRIVLTDTSVHIGNRSHSREALANNWKPWDDVNTSVQALQTPLTQVEYELLESVPVTDGARNGLSELVQVHEQTMSIKFTDEPAKA